MVSAQAPIRHGAPGARWQWGRVMRRRTSVVLLSLLVTAGVVFYFVLKPGQLDIPAPVVGHAAPSSVGTTPSRIQIELAVKLAALQEAVNARAPRRFGGERSDPTDTLAEDRLDWHLQLGEIALAPQDGAIGFSAPFSGQATIRGVAGVPRRNSARPGSTDASHDGSVREIAQFGGVLRGTMKPVFRTDWTIDPQLTATVDLDTAEARLFGRALNLNFRGMVERKVREKVAGFAADMNRRMRTDDTIRNEAGKAWNALHLVTSVYRSPPVWVSMTPKSVGVAPPVVTDEDLILRTAATVHASVHVRREPPAIGSVALPGLTPLTGPGGEFSLAVPVALELNSFHAVPPGDLKLPDTFETPAGRVHVRRLFLLGDAGTLYVGAEVTARTGLLERVSGTVYLAGQPVLDEDGNTLRIENLRYDVRTSNELVRTANVLLHPAVLAELRKRAVF